MFIIHLREVSIIWEMRDEPLDMPLGDNLEGLLRWEDRHHSLSGIPAWRTGAERRAVITCFLVVEAMPLCLPYGSDETLPFL